MLLTNAMNYTPQGGHIEVGAILEQRAGEPWAGFFVKDDGSGVSNEEMPKLFERFHRGKVGRDSGVPGTGLGLAIANTITRRHSGHTDVKSEGVPGRGTTFTVWIPAGEPSSRPTQARGTDESNGTSCR